MGTMAERNEKTEIFERMPVPRALTKLAVPTIVSQLITLVYNMADTWFIARTNDAILVAGVSLCAPLFTLLMAIGNIFGQGGSSLISRLLGNKDNESILRVSSFCFYLSILAGLAIEILLLLLYRPVLGLLGASPQTFGPARSYYTVIVLGAPFIILSFIHSNLIRSEGMSTLSMIGTVAGSLLNIVLDPIFISTFGLGARGAALATVLGYVLTDALCLIFVLRRSRVLSVDFRRFHVSHREFSQIFGVGITAALTNIASSICIVFMNKYLLPYKAILSIKELTCRKCAACPWGLIVAS